MESSGNQFFENLLRVDNRHQDTELPLISIIIPSSNAAQTIAITIESILMQDYPAYEVIVVDCSLDRTADIVKEFRSEKLHFYAAGICHRYELINKGLTQATGFYVNLLFPGDFYIHKNVLRELITFALDHHRPDLVYCGTILRNEQEVKTLFRPLNIELLKKGQQPTSLQSCWFRKEALAELGKFDPKYQIRGGFELLCRFCLKKHYTYMGLHRVLIDYDLRVVTRTMVITHFLETMKALYTHFGFWVTLKWLFLYQKDLYRFLKLWWNSLKIAFFGTR